MKIIHTADIHLDSPLVSVADPVLRRYELMMALSNMSDYADKNGVRAVIVAGDLFDGEFVSESTIAGVADIINRSKAAWFVLQGNHGGSASYVKLKKLSPRVNLFGSDWSYYALDNVVICGRELGQNDAEYYKKLTLDVSKYNIVVLHGDVDDCSYGLIDRKALAQSRANYVALGHRHSLSQYFFGSVKACYSGALEPRGFDEQAKTGFIVVDTDSDKISFVEQHIRSVCNITVDVTDVANDIALTDGIVDATKYLDERNYLNVAFCGALRDGIHLQTVANSVLQGKFFALRIEDKTTSAYDLSAIANEISLRGEFVKLASAIGDEDLKTAVLKMGLQALRGEDLT